LKLGAQISIWHKDSRKGRDMIKNHMHTHMYIHIQYTRMYIHTHTYVCTHSVRHLLPAPPPCLDQECGYNRGILCHMYAHTHTHTIHACTYLLPTPPPCLHQVRGYDRGTPRDTPLAMDKHPSWF
jgi:hypothetical protein